MKNKNETLYVDSVGYQKLLDEIDRLKTELVAIGKEKGEAYSSAVGDGWHDNFAFDEVNLQERMLRRRLSECYKQLQNVVVVERHSDENLIDVGDIVTVNMIFDLDDSDEFQFRLVGSIGIHESDDSNLQEVSINSPLGKSVYHKSIGEHSCYTVEGRIFNVEILTKTSEQDYIEGKQKKKTK